MTIKNKLKNFIYDTALCLYTSFQMFKKLRRQRKKGNGFWWDKDFFKSKDLNQMVFDHIDRGDPLDVINLCAMKKWRGEKMELKKEKRSKNKPSIPRFSND